MTRPFRRLACLVLAAGIGSGCAVFETENRRLLNWMDTKVRPEATATQVALAPVGVPVGSAALAVDAVLVHPYTAIPRAAEDVYELYWKPRDMEAFRKALLLPLIVIATPPTFLGDWLVRSLVSVE